MVKQEGEISAIQFPPYNGWIDNGNGARVVIIGTLLPGIATITVFLRLYLRASQKTGIGADDVVIAAALVRGLDRAENRDLRADCRHSL